jgi:alcohol dehydrogenase class IV
LRFIHETLAQRVRFAAGDAAGQLAAEVADLGASRIMVIASARDSGLARRLAEGLPVAVWHHEVVMHVPVEVARRAQDRATAEGIDLVVCIGGGSATGLAKVVARESRVPIVAVPTTYAGSEATNVWGMTETAVKTTGIDPAVLPRTVVYDATLTLGLPTDLSVASGLNALAHCIDALWAPRADPINAALVTEGMRALATGLPQVKSDPADLPARELVLYGAYLAAVGFASAGSGLHHKICHVLGGMFDLPHAQTHSVVLPHVLAFNVPAAAEADARIARALGSGSATQGLAKLYDEVDVHGGLRSLGMPDTGIGAAADAVCRAAPADNPTAVTTTNITELLHAAWEGVLPR